MNSKIVTDNKDNVSKKLFSLQNFFILISLYHLSNILLFLLRMALAPISTPEVVVFRTVYTIIFLCFAYFCFYAGINTRDRKNNSYYKLMRFWVIGIFASIIIRTIFANIFIHKTKILLQSQIWTIIISISLCLLYTGFIVKKNSIKFLAALFILYPFLINLLPNTTTIMSNDLGITYYLYPLYIDFIIVFISIYLFFETNKQLKS